MLHSTTRSFRQCALVGALAAAFAAPSFAQTAEVDARIKLLADQIEALKKQVEDMKAAAPAPAAAASVAPNVVTAGTLPNSWKIPGTNTSLKIGGYAKLDMQKDLSGGGIGGVTAIFGQIPLSGSAQSQRNGNFYLSARQSRLNFSTSTPTALGDLYTFVEGDFYGIGGNEVTTNSASLRLRHAYAKVGGWLVGQWWSNYSNLGSIPEAVDFGGSIGLPQAIRAPQLRYTIPLGSDELAFSLENPEADFNGALNSTYAAGQTLQGGNFTDKLPDVVARYQLNRPWGNFAVAGVLRKQTIDNVGGTAVNGFIGRQSADGHGVQVSGRWNYSGKSGLMANYTTGKGIGRYIYGFPVNDGAAIVNGQLESIRSTGITIGLQHYWNNQWRSNLMWGGIKVDYPHPAVPVATISKLQSFHVNTMWNPTPQLTLGLEYQYGKVENDAIPTPTLSNKGKASRLQAAATVAF
jgi:hypothetical protein